MTIKPGTLLKASIILLTVFASCKETETIKRDIIITPAPVEFTIPIIINTNSGQVAGDMLDTVNIEAEMRKATVEFGVDNIRDLRITAFKLELLDIPLANDNNRRPESKGNPKLYHHCRILAKGLFSNCFIPHHRLADGEKPEQSGHDRIVHNAEIIRYEQYFDAELSIFHDLTQISRQVKQNLAGQQELVKDRCSLEHN
jgi:hypothetical protein